MAKQIQSKRGKEMDYRELIDPELRKSAVSYPFNKGIIDAGNLYQEIDWRMTKIPAEVKEEMIVTEGTGSLPVRTTVFSPRDSGAKLPALVYVHGGAFVYKAASYQKRLAIIYAMKTGCKVFFPHYHLAPKFPYPAAYEDVLSVYRYVLSHADELGIDKERVGIAGDSAGASVAALVCNRWEEERITIPCLQMLVYPVTDARMETDSMARYTDTPQWNSQTNERMWAYYCGDDSELRDLASPMHCPLPWKIPDTYIETAQFDCLHDEGVGYAKKLAEAGAVVELNETEGTYHGYDAETDAQIVIRNINRRVSFLNCRFNEK